MPIDLQGITTQDLVVLLSLWQRQPEVFCKDIFGDVLWHKQIEVLQAVAQYPKVCAKSGNTVGKSAVAARVALWFLTCFRPSKVITTAPTFQQIESILWKEIGTLNRKQKIDLLGGELLKTELNVRDDWFAIGISTNEVNRFQGFHAENLLVIIDEALGVDPMIWEAIEGLHPKKILAIGNPLTPEGEFFKCFSSPLWHKITISCLDAVKWQIDNVKIPGLVTLEWVEERKAEWGVESPLFQARVLGEFPQDVENTLIRLSWVEEARKRVLEQSDDEVKIVGADLATKHGANLSVVGYRVGHDIEKVHGHLNAPAFHIKTLIRKEYEKNEANNIIFDADGLGENFGEILETEHLGYTEFHGGRSAKAMDSTRFKNLRSQMYTIVAKKFEKGLYSLKKLDEKDYELLKNQLCSIKTKWPDALGRTQIETKEDMASRGMPSPDYADCFMMMEFGFFMEKFSDVKAYRYR